MGGILVGSHNTRSEKFGNTEVLQVSPCPLCGQSRPLEQDHNHETDLCRGQLCHACNVQLGQFDRPIAEIQRFIDYLRFWEAEHAAHGGRSYTDYMREAYPLFRKRGRPRLRRSA